MPDIQRSLRDNDAAHAAEQNGFVQQSLIWVKLWLHLNDFCKPYSQAVQPAWCSLKQWPKVVSLDEYHGGVVEGLHNPNVIKTLEQFIKLALSQLLSSFGSPTSSGLIQRSCLPTKLLYSAIKATFSRVCSNKTSDS